MKPLMIYVYLLSEKTSQHVQCLCRRILSVITFSVGFLMLVFNYHILTCRGFKSYTHHVSPPPLPRRMNPLWRRGRKKKKKRKQSLSTLSAQLGSNICHAAWNYRCPWWWGSQSDREMLTAREHLFFFISPENLTWVLVILWLMDKLHTWEVLGKWEVGCTHQKCFCKS